MQARLVRQPFHFVRVDLASVVVYPVVGVLALSIVGKSLIALGMVGSFYASPFVALCALVSNRVCFRAGFVAAVLSVLVHDFLFAMPYWELNAPSREQILAYIANFLVAWGVARKQPPSAASAPTPPAGLPFTNTDDKEGDQQRRFWTVEPGGDWIEDCTVGSEYGRIYVDDLRSKRQAPLLCWVVRDMIKGGRYSGVEAGFLSTIERAVSRSRPHQNTSDLSAD